MKSLTVKIFEETQKIPRKKPKEALKTLENILPNQHSIKVSRKGRVTYHFSDWIITYLATIFRRVPQLSRSLRPPEML